MADEDEIERLAIAMHDRRPHPVRGRVVREDGAHEVIQFGKPPWDACADHYQAALRDEARRTLQRH